MVDFSKFRTPEAREKLEQARKLREAENKKRDDAIRFMIAKLVELVENDKIPEHEEYDIGFIQSVNSRFNSGLPLTEKQEAYLEKLFHYKY